MKYATLENGLREKVAIQKHDIFTLVCRLSIATLFIIIQSDEYYTSPKFPPKSPSVIPIVLNVHSPRFTNSTPSLTSVRKRAPRVMAVSCSTFIFPRIARSHFLRGSRLGRNLATVSARLNNNIFYTFPPRRKLRRFCVPQISAWMKHA